MGSGSTEALMLPVQTSRQLQQLKVGGRIRWTIVPALPSVRPASSSALLAQKEPEGTVFDAEGAVSWDDYKKQRPEEFKLDEGDEKQCWRNDECLVEDRGKFTKAWNIRSAERIPTTETHFDSEGDWEEENHKAWFKKWYEDVGEEDLHEGSAYDSSRTGHPYDI